MLSAASPVSLARGWACSALGLAVVLVLHAPAAAAAPPPSKSAAAAPAADPAVGSLPRNAAARSRMLECGHQWSNMKRAGTATGTWKDFSRGCLAQR